MSSRGLFRTQSPCADILKVQKNTMMSNVFYSIVVTEA